MRTIKFRAWEESAKFMINDFEAKDCFQSVLTGENEYSYDYTIMQYTGLKDKNGNPVYEGDLLHNDDPEYGVGVIEFSSKYNGWILNDNYDETGADDLTVILNNDYKIIGNIYEDSI